MLKFCVQEAGTPTATKILKWVNFGIGGRPSHSGFISGLSF